MIPVAKPDVGDKELAQVAEAFESGWIGLGPKVDEFEQRFGEAFNHSNVIATNSCTNALDLAVKSLELEGTEILVPPITWISTAHAAAYNNYDIGWVDVEPGTLTMSPDSLREQIGDDTAAVIPVHYGGQPAAIDEITQIAHNYGAAVIEDCAHAPGASFDGQSLGSIGDVGCFSFQATKPLTTGEGGALVTDDDEIADRARRLSKLGVNKSTHERSQGDESKYDWYYKVTEVGYKYFMHDISAALGLAQLDRFDGLQRQRNELADVYADMFETIDWASPLERRPSTTHSWYNYTVLVPPAYRDDLIKHLGRNDVGATVHYMPLYKHPVFDQTPDTPVAESIWEEIVTLPMSSTFDEDDIIRVVDTVRNYSRVE